MKGTRAPRYVWEKTNRGPGAVIGNIYIEMVNEAENKKKTKNIRRGRLVGSGRRSIPMGLELGQRFPRVSDSRPAAFPPTRTVHRIARAPPRPPRRKAAPHRHVAQHRRDDGAGRGPAEIVIITTRDDRALSDGGVHAHTLPEESARPRDFCSLILGGKKSHESVCPSTMSCTMFRTRDNDNK